MSPYQLNIQALCNCLARAGIKPPFSAEAALAWADSTKVNKLEVQAEALRLAGLELDPEIYEAALLSARHFDAANKRRHN